MLGVFLSKSAILRSRVQYGQYCIRLDQSECRHFVHKNINHNDDTYDDEIIHINNIYHYGLVMVKTGSTGFSIGFAVIDLCLSSEHSCTLIFDIS